MAHITSVLEQHNNTEMVNRNALQSKCHR